MTRDEFESILEEAYIEGYNSALEDIQEDILDEEAFDLEDDYDYYTESNKETKARNRETAKKVWNVNDYSNKRQGRENTFNEFTGKIKQKDDSARMGRSLLMHNINSISNRIATKDPKVIKDALIYYKLTKGIPKNRDHDKLPD